MRDIRGRRRNSSFITSCQRSSTSLDLVKKRWPPRSKRKPSRTSVFAMPPTWSSASNLVLHDPPALSPRHEHDDGTPLLRQQVSGGEPAGPPPRTATGFSDRN